MRPRRNWARSAPGAARAVTARLGATGVSRGELALWKSAGSIEAHAARLAAKAKELDEDTGVERLHFVGHSMGAIVVRSALAMTRPRKLGRVVLLAPPNCGARLADLALRLFGRRLVAATELCSHPDSYVNRLAQRRISIAASSRRRGTTPSRSRRRTCRASAITWSFAACIRSRCIGTRRRKWGISCAKVVSCARPAEAAGTDPADQRRHRPASRRYSRSTKRSAGGSGALSRPASPMEAITCAKPVISISASRGITFRSGSK